jgi:predicted nucleic acid-binding protein
MLIVDASCLYEVISEGPLADAVRGALEEFEEMGAPEFIDLEVLGLIRRETRLGLLHESRAAIAVAESSDRCGEKFTHHPFSERVWALRENVRTWDAYNVALAEALDVPMVTLDRGLARAVGPECEFIIPGSA